MTLAALVALASLPTASASGVPLPTIDPLGCSGWSLGPDQGEYVCVTPDDPECLVSVVHVTIAGPMRFCLVP